MLYHTDGILWDVFDEIIDCGVDAIHPIEPKAMALCEVKKRVGDRLCLLGGVDLGYTLTRGTPAEVEEEVRRNILTAAPGGGYCVGSAFFKASLRPWLLLSGPPSITRQPSS